MTSIQAGVFDLWIARDLAMDILHTSGMVSV